MSEATATSTTAAPAATATNASAPSPTPSAATSTPAPVTTEWTTGLNDDLKSYVQTKGFKDTTAVLESYRNMEKLHGVPAERILKIPDNLDTPEGRAIFEKLGAPKDPKDYKIEIPKEHGDENLASWLRDTAAKYNLTHRQLEGLVAGWNERTGTAIKSMTEQQQTFLKQADDNLKKEWGAAYEQNKGLADQGAIALGMGEKEVKALGAALGPDKAMMLLHKLATATGEASFVSGGAPAAASPGPTL
jgi:hypothetical protein